MNGIAVPNKAFVTRASAAETLLSNLAEFAGSDLDSVALGGSAALQKKLQEFRRPGWRQATAGEL